MRGNDLRAIFHAKTREAGDDCAFLRLLPSLQGFVRPGSRKILQSGNSPEEILDNLLAYQPPVSLVESLKAEAQQRP